MPVDRWKFLTSLDDVVCVELLKLDSCWKVSQLDWKVHFVCLTMFWWCGRGSKVFDALLRWPVEYVCTSVGWFSFGSLNRYYIAFIFEQRSPTSAKVTLLDKDHWNILLGLRYPWIWKNSFPCIFDYISTLVWNYFEMFEYSRSRSLPVLPVVGSLTDKGTKRKVLLTSKFLWWSKTDM